MRFGFAVLRLSPKDFWAMTPRELAAAMRAFGQDERGPRRSDLSELMRRFPDR